VSIGDAVKDLIEAQAMNALLRVIDGMAAAREWDDLLDLADLCEAAVERGKQMWPIAAHIDYRLALEAPGDLAAAVLESHLVRFHPGPLSEVAASTHTWAELAPHIEAPHTKAYVAQERVLRGEDLTGVAGDSIDVLELPLVLQPWEPTYALATYKPDHVEVAEPWSPKAPLAPFVSKPAERLREPDIENGLTDLVAPWTAESNGAARAIVVEGDAASAVAALLDDARPARIGKLSSQEAVQRLAWAAASGGAHGRRRGAAFGRWLTWHTLALLLDRPWPVDPAALGEEVDALEWYRWDEGAPEEGWVLRIAVGDPELGWAAALAASDLLETSG
jgi:hypothetical protein